MSLFEGLGDELQVQQEQGALVPEPKMQPTQEPTLGAATENPFAGLADELDPPDPLKATITEASKKNPDAFARAAKIARTQGVSPQIIEPDVDEFERRIKLNKMRVDDAAKEFAVTAGFFRDFDNAAQFHDDFDFFTGAEKWLSDKTSYLGSRFDTGQITVELGNLQSRRVYNLLIGGGVPLTEDDELRIKELRNMRQVAAYSEEQGQLMKALGSAAEQIPNYLSMADLAARPLAAGLTTGAAAGAVAGATAAAPTVIGEPAGIAAGAITGGLLGLRSMMPVAKAAAVKKILDLEIGNAFDEFSQFKDADGNVLDEQTAAYAAATYGAVAAGLESFSLGKVAKVFSGPKDAFNRLIKQRIKTIMRDKTMRQKLVDLGKNYAGMVATEAVTEGMQEGAQVIAGAFAKYADSDSFTDQDMSAVLNEIFSVETLERVGEASVEGARASAVIGAAGTATTMVVDGVRAETKTEGEQRKIDELAALVKESKGIQRNPEAVKEFLQQAATEDDNVYVPAEKMLEYLDEAGIDPYKDPLFQPIAKQIDEAATLGGDVVIPIPDFVTGIAASEHFDPLRQHMRLSADTLAPSEMQQVRENADFVSQLIAAAEGEAETYQEAQSVFEEVRDQLIDTGRATPQVAKLQAQIIPAYVTRLAMETGRGVRELFDEMALMIKGPLAEQQAENAARAAELGVTFEQPVKDQQKADDLISEISDFAEVSDDGLVTVYHRTTPEAAAKIRETGVMVPKEDGLFFSTKRDGQAAGYGDEIVELKIPADQLELDDIFTDEAHLRFPARVGKPYDISGFIGGPRLSQSTAAGPRPRGYYDTSANMIRLLQASDLSTFLHESAHFFLEMEKRFNPDGVQGVNEWFSRNAASIAAEANKYLSRSGELGQESTIIRIDSEGDVDKLQTGQSISFPFIHNTESATKLFGKPKKGDRFQRDIEPSGRYVTIGKPWEGMPANMITGDLVLVNPLVVNSSKWKQELYDKYKKTGKSLSKKLISEGYDGVVTTADGKYISEIVEFTTFDETKALYQAQKPPGTAAGPITETMVQQYLDQGTTGDAAVDDAINRATHEQFARGFEIYLMEGTAPSLELREAFRAFARWLVDLYRKMRGDLQVNLDDQMRKVFDRLLATEDQIAAVEAMNRYRPLFSDAAMAGMTEEEFAAYQERQRKATDKAKESLQEKLFKELKRETEAWWQDEKSERVRTITEELQTQRVYKAIDTLREKGGELKLDRVAVREMLGVDRVPDKLRGMTLTGMQGVPPDDAAAFLGYASGSEMINDIMNSRPIKEVANEQAEAEMKATHGDILNDGTLEKAAQDAAHNEERGRQILVELKSLAKSQNRPSIDRAAIKALAEEQIHRMPLTKILPAKYRRAEIRAAMDAQKAMDAGDKAAALQAKMRQAMNFYLWRSAEDARNKADKIVRFTRKYKKKSIRDQIAKAGNGYLDQIDGLLDRFEFDKSVKKTQAERQAITEWALGRADDGDNIQLTKEALDETLRKHYKEIPFATLLGIYDSIRNIDHVARFANKVNKDGELLDFLEVKRDVLQHLDKLPKKYRAMVSDVVSTSLATKSRWAMAQMTKLPMLFSWLDGGKRIGLMHTLLSQPFTDAAEQRMRLYEQVGKKIVDAIKNRSKEDKKRHNRKIHIPEAVTDVNDGTFVGHQLISVALNTGNQSNLEKMLKGEGWVSPDATEEEITVENPALQAVLSRLTESDWDMVEMIWSQIDELFPLMAEVHKRTSGIDLPKIEAVEFNQPVTVDGRTVTRRIKGGYYPVKYDANRGEQAERNEQRQQAMLDSMFGPGGMLRPSATTGAKIERTNFFAPMRFSLDVVPNHIDEVIQYITHYEAVRQVYKLTHDPDIKAAIKQRVGKEEFDQIRPWLNDIAKDGKETPPKQLWDPLLQKLRHGVTLGMMGFKVTTGLMQISGLSNSVGEVGTRHMARGMRHVLGSLGSIKDAKAMWAFVTDRSKIMADRIDTMDREMMAAMKALRGKAGILPAVQEASMKHIAYIQTYTVDLPTWFAAYYKGLEEAQAELDANDYQSHDAYTNAVEKQAIRRADWTVENVQGSGMTKDMARIMRNQTETGRLLTMFFSFFSSLWNMQRDTARGALSGQYSPTTIAAKLLFIYAIPVAYEMAMRGELEDDDEKTAAEKYLTTLALYPLQTVPVVRDVANAAGSGYGFQMTPVASIMAKGIDGSTKAAKAMVTDEEISKAQAKNASKLVGAYFGMPGVSQAWNTGEHLYNVIEEGDELTMQELLFGPKREE